MLITSVRNRRVAAVLALRKHREREASGCFIAEGPREVARAAEAGLPLLELYVCPAILARHPGHESLMPPERITDKAATFEVTAEVLRKMAYRDEPEGVLAVFEQPQWEPDALQLEADALLLVAVGIAKPGNLGAMARTVEAVGGAAMLCVDSVVDPFNPNAIRSSTGAVFSLPCLDVDTAAAQAWLIGRDVRCVATSPEAADLYHDVLLRGRCAIVIGAEDQGLPEAWLSFARARGDIVKLPMRGRLTDSLNAGTTAAVMLYEALRQRG